MPSFTTVGSSEDPYIDGLISGRKWTDAVVTFSFPTAVAQYGVLADYPNVPGSDTDQWTDGFVPFRADFAAVARTAFQMIGGYVSDIAFSEGVASPAGATIRFGNSTTYDGVGGFSLGVGTEDWRGDIWMAGDWAAGRPPVAIGDLAWIVVLHEIGHSLGLVHPDEADGVGGASMPIDRESHEFTVMSYKAHIMENRDTAFAEVDGHYPQSFMMYDIAALQYLYGADFTTNAGSTTYSFAPLTGEMFVNRASQGLPAANILFRTIWDGGGTDTYDFSQYTTDLVLDLAPGGWTDVDRHGNFQAANLNRHYFDPVNPTGPEVYARGQVFNALLYEGDTRSLIENALGGFGDDVMRGNQAGNALQGRDGDDSLYGFDGNDALFSGAGGGLMDGGSGDDGIYAGDGAEIIEGGSGRDHLLYTFSTAAVKVNLLTGTAFGGSAQGDLIAGIEELDGSPFDDVLTGDGGANLLNGALGNDLLEGYGGADSLFGSGGNDTLVGGAGADSLNGATGTDVARYAGAAITLNLLTGVHIGDAAGDVFSGIETFEGSSFADVLVGNDAAQTLDGRLGNDAIQGQGGADTLIGGAGFDGLDGGAGNDRLVGGAAADSLVGGAGFDTADFTDIGDDMVIDLASGSALSDDGIDNLSSVENVLATAFGDTVSGNAAANLLSGLGGDDRITGRDGADSLLGGEGSDTVFGGEGDSLDGGAGTDELSIGPSSAVTINLVTGVHGGAALGTVIAGFEIIRTGTGNDDVRAGAAAVTLISSTGNDTLRGSALGDLLDGGGDADRIFGVGGNDTILAGFGNDSLEGGAGADLIVIGRLDGTDQIVGHTSGTDRIGLDQSTFGIAAAAAIGDYLHVGAAAPDATHGWFLIDGSLLRWDEDGAGGTAAITLALFAGGISPAVTDFEWA